MKTSELDFSMCSVVEALMEAQVRTMIETGKPFRIAILSPVGAMRAVLGGGHLVLSRAKGHKAPWVKGALAALDSPLAPIMLVPDAEAKDFCGVLTDGVDTLMLRLSA